MNELALFAGAGGGILGGKLLGFRTICAVEHDAYARDVLVARQNDGCLEAFPVWDDVCTFDGRPWRGLVDVVSGGFPCQDISVAGKGEGLAGKRSGLWGEMRRIIGEVRPRIVLVENSPALTVRGLGTVLGDLAAMGYDARWGVLGAIDTGAPHKRERIWIVAYDPKHGRRARRQGGSDSSGAGKREQPLQTLAYAECSERRPPCSRFSDHQGRGFTDSLSQREENAGRPGAGREVVAYAHGAGCEKQRGTIADGEEHEAIECGDWWCAEPDVGRVAHGVAARVDRLRCLGNGQVPAVVRLAWDRITQDDES